MSVIGNRYAQALFELSKQENSVDEYCNELSAITEIYNCENKLREFLLCPQYDTETKKQLLKNIFGEKVNIKIINFLMLLLDKNRIDLLREIQTEYVKLADKEKNVLNITIMTAVELEQNYINCICNKFKALYKSDYCRASVKTDSSLIGGIKIAVGNKLYDATVKGNLKRLLSEITV